MTTLAEVQALARLVPIFPCRATTDGKRKAKSPLTANGFLDASQDVDQVAAWYDAHPGCLWGVPMGSRTRLVAIDYDPDKATIETQAWVEAHVSALMAARQHTTARNGRHYIFHAGNGTLYHTGADVMLDGCKRPGLDIRAEGGYIIWWPLAGLHWQNKAPELPAGLIDDRAFHAPAQPRVPVPASPGEWGRSRARVADALAHVDPQPYDTWLRTGMAIHHASAGSDDGFDLWHGWSSGGVTGDMPHSYSGIEACRDKWDSFGRNHGTRLSLGSLFNDAKGGGYVPQEQKKTTESNVPQETNYTQDIHSPEESPNPKRGRPRSKPDGSPPAGTEFDGDGAVQVSLADLAVACNDKGTPHGNVANAAAVLARHPKLVGNIWYDEFHDRIFSTLWGEEPQQWAEHHDTRMTMWMQSELGMIRTPTPIVREAVQQYARLNVRNEPKEWLESLTWDGTPRLPYLMADGFGAPYNQYSAAVGRCFMVGMVARVMLPGCKLDAVPVFEGAQGAGKSSGLAILGGKWFAESHESVTSKDFFQALQGKLLIEISELHAFRRADIERIKGVITCQTDRYRASYGHYTKDYPRRCVFGGTTNVSDWNADETGARRFWPITCTTVDRDWLRRHRADLFAEAMALFKKVPLTASDVERIEAGADWWTVPDDEARAEQEMRRDADVWEEAIAIYVASRNEVKVADILSNLLEIERRDQDRSDQMRVAKTLKALGWVVTVRKESGTAVRNWIKVKSQERS